jgi:hypothetical protein
MEIRTFPVLIKLTASSAILKQVSGTPINCQAISFPPLADIVSHSPRSGRTVNFLRYDIDAALISNFCPLRSTAQMILASFAASATTTVLTCALASRLRSQSPRGVCALDSVGNAARAP